jgi:transcriptional regulator with XRE-family HTH domain
MKNKDFTTELAEMLPPERVARARKEAEKEIFQIRLSELRKKMGIRQEDIKSFSQSGISKLEARKDIKISTLIEYLKNLGLGIEIKAYQKHKGEKKTKEYVLLKT